ncbi:MAG: hypothetical protein WBY44_14505 [Bryobacteraceae bacterium]
MSSRKRESNARGNTSRKNRQDVKHNEPENRFWRCPERDANAELGAPLRDEIVESTVQANHRQQESKYMKKAESTASTRSRVIDASTCSASRWTSMGIAPFRQAMADWIALAMAACGSGVRSAKLSEWKLGA